MRLVCLHQHGCIQNAVELCCKYKCIYFTLLSMFMIKYTYSSFVNAYFLFYRGRTMKMVSLMRKVLTLSTLERG
jgi:hypothetical protein